MGTSETAESFLGYRLANRYQLTELLGIGAMGFVFIADDLELPRTVAVKMVRPDLAHDEVVRRRVERECAMHASVGMHPNIITLHDRIIEDGKIFLIMEYIEGKTLTDILKAQRENQYQISFNQSIQIVTQLLAALEVIHNNNIVHRDIKPSNIIVIPPKSQDDSTTVKLMDFGIARSEDEDSDLTRLTAFDSAGPGTPAYMAPERIDHTSFGNFSPATDLYSLGIIFYELIHTQPPFQGSLTDVFTAHITKPPDIILLELSSSFKGVLAKSLEKAQKDRFKTATEFKDAVDAALSELSTESISDKSTDDGREGITLLSTPEMHLHVDAPWKESNAPPARSTLHNRRAKMVCSFILVAISLSVLIYFQSFKNETLDLADESVTNIVPVDEIPVVSDLISKPVEKQPDILYEDSLTDKNHTKISPPSPEVEPTPTYNQFSYSPPSDYFEGGGQFGLNPSPYTSRDDQTPGGAERIVENVIRTDVIVPPKKRMLSESKSKKTYKRLNNSPQFEIKKYGTRSISSE